MEITKNGRTAGQASPGLGRPGGYALRNGSSNNSIPQNLDKSNTFAENISKDAAILNENENPAEKGYKIGTSQLINTNKGPDATSELGSVVVPNNSIPQNSENSNTLFFKI